MSNSGNKPDIAINYRDVLKTGKSSYEKTNQKFMSTNQKLRTRCETDCSVRAIIALTNDRKSGRRIW